MDDLITLDGGISAGYRNPFMTGVARPSAFSFGTPAVTGRSISSSEQGLLSDSQFTFDRRKRGLLSRAIGGVANTFSLGLTDMATGSRRSGLKNVSRGLTLRGVSQADYNDLLNLDLFRGGGLDDVTGTEISKATYKANQAGQIARTSGEELSLLDEEGLERLSQVVAARQGQILGNTLSPGLGAQGFSLLSGNFS